MKKKPSKTALISKLLAQGLSTSDIAKKAKCSVGYVYKVRSESGVASKSKVPTVEQAVKYAEQIRDISQTLDERGRRYGLFIGQAAASQDLKAVVYSVLEDRGTAMNPDQLEAMEMICHKMARILNGDPDYSDSWHDIAGYAKLVADRLEGRIR